MIPGGTTAGEALLAAASAGDFFTLAEVDPADQDGGWRPLGDLLGPALTEQVEVGRAALARLAGQQVEVIEPRAAASVLFLGLAARLVSPSMGAAVLGGAVPRLAVADLRWRSGDSGAVVIGADRASLTRSATPVGGQLGRAADAIARHTLEGAVRPVLEATRLAFRLSPKVLWGNVASAIGGAVQVLSRSAPERAQAATALGRAVLTLAPLAGTTAPLTASTDWPPRRRSCCLFYRVPGAGLCRDCVLARP